eukprot:2243570-Alexandrium_andersonii.AAC.1
MDAEAGFEMRLPSTRKRCAQCDQNGAGSSRVHLSALKVLAAPVGVRRPRPASPPVLPRTGCPLPLSLEAKGV